MQLETVLENINLAIKSLEGKRSKEINNALYYLETAKTDLEETIRTVSNKNTGGLSRSKAANSILKTAKERGYGGCWDAGGKQCLCDGVRAYRFLNPLDLPILENRTPPDLSSFFSPQNQYHKTDTPRPKLIRAENKIFRAGLPRNQKHDGIWRLSANGSNIYVNAIYLAEAIEAMGPDVELYIPAEENQPIYFKSKDGSDGILSIMKLSSTLSPAILNPEVKKEISA